MRRFLLSLVVVGCSMCLLTTSVYAAKGGNKGGKSGDTPGQSKDKGKDKEDAPGQSGDAPGQGGSSPGKSENAPGSQFNVTPLVNEPITTQVLRSPAVTRESSPEDFLYYGPSPAHNSESFGIATPVGGILVSNSEEYEKVGKRIEITVQLYQAGLLSKEETQKRIDEALPQLDEATREKRFFGVGHRCRGQNLFNLLGLLCR